MEYWFGKSKEELYENTEAINSDVYFFISEKAPVMHSGIHIYSYPRYDKEDKKDLVNFISGGKLISYRLPYDYPGEYHNDSTDEKKSGGYLLIRHYCKYDETAKEKDLIFYVLYTNLLPVKYYHFVKTEGMEKTYSNEVSKKDIADYEFFKYRIPFYLKYTLTVMEGYEIEVLGKGMPVNSQHKAVMKDDSSGKLSYEYMIKELEKEGDTNEKDRDTPAGVTCSIVYLGKRNKVQLGDVEIVKDSTKVKIKSGTQVYTAKDKKLGTVNKETYGKCIKLKKQDGENTGNTLQEERKVLVKLKGEELSITKGGYVVVDKSQEGNLYRVVENSDPVIYAPIAIKNDDPSEEEMEKFLRYFYPLRKIKASDINNEEYIYKQNGKIYINEKRMKPLEEKFEQSESGDIKYFYRITGKEIEIGQPEQEADKRKSEEMTEEDLQKIDENAEFYKDTFDEDEDRSQVNRYKVRQSGGTKATELKENKDGKKVELIEANLYITSNFEENIYIDISGIEGAEFRCKIIKSDGIERGLLVYDGKVPKEVIKEEEPEEIRYEYASNIYNEYKKMMSESGTPGKEKLVGIGGNRVVCLRRDTDIKFRIEMREGYSTEPSQYEEKEIQHNAILGRMARQTDREYADISVFTFENSIYNHTMWTIPAGTKIYDTGKQWEDAVKGDIGDIIEKKDESKYLERMKNDCEIILQFEKKRKCYFQYGEKLCYVKNGLIIKKSCITNPSFREVKIEDHNFLIAEKFKIYDFKKRKYKGYRWQKLPGLLRESEEIQEEETNKGGLRESIRRAMIIKPLEFDREKTGKDFVRRLEELGVYTYDDEGDEGNGGKEQKKDEETDDIYGKLKKDTVDFKNMENRFCFYHPVTFIDIVKNNIRLECNPYAGKTYGEVYGNNQFPEIAGKNITDPQGFVIVDNPGFAPVYDKQHSLEGPNINGYAPVTGFFNEDYLDVKAGNGQTYRENGYTVFNHEGVDFRGSAGTEIKSLIYGTVLAYGKYGPYGRAIFVCNRERTGVYLLAHLSDYNGDILKKVEIIPGDVVGYVGTSGDADTSGNIDGRYASHLHVSYYKIVEEMSEDDIESKIVKKTDDIIERGDYYKNMSERNPFHHESKRKTSEGGKK